MTPTRTVRFSRPRKPVEPSPLIEPPDPVIWHETGGWSVWTDDTERHPSRAFARDVWLQRHSRKEIAGST
jgi:hypothetical protein